MIGDDPYTLGLFDTAGMTLLCSVSRAIYITIFVAIASNRSGGLRPSSTTIISPDRRLLGMLQRDISGVIRERQGEMVPRGSPPLSWRALPYRRYTD